MATNFALDHISPPPSKNFKKLYFKFKNALQYLILSSQLKKEEFSLKALKTELCLTIFLEEISCSDPNLMEDLTNNNAGPDSIKRLEKVFKIYLKKNNGYLKEASEICQEFEENIKKVSSQLIEIDDLLKRTIKNVRLYKQLFASPYEPYGEQMVKLMKLIEKSTGLFKEMPKGPMGTYITVLESNSKWLSLIEHILTPYLFMFIADNNEDMIILQGLIDKVYGIDVGMWKNDYSRRPSVWITKFKLSKESLRKIAYKTMEQSSSSPTAFDLVKISNYDTVITSFLIEEANLSSLILFDTQHDAFPILSDKKALPKNCKLGYTRDNYKIYPYPSFKTRQIEVGEAKYIMINVPPFGLLDSKVEKLERSLVGLENDRKRMRNDQHELTFEIIKIKGEIDGVTKAYHFIKSVIQEFCFYSPSSLEVVMTMENYYEAEEKFKKRKENMENLMARFGQKNKTSIAREKPLIRIASRNGKSVISTNTFIPSTHSIKCFDVICKCSWIRNTVFKFRERIKSV